MTVGSPKPMQAWVVTQPGPIETGPLRYVDKPVPDPAPGELLVHVRVCAVCRTDLHVSEGDLPVHREHVTPGHMVVGLVTALGEGVTDYDIGQIPDHQEFINDIRAAGLRIALDPRRAPGELKTRWTELKI